MYVLLCCDLKAVTPPGQPEVGLIGQLCSPLGVLCVAQGK